MRLTCRGGGIGRRTGLKILRGQPHESSILSPGTTVMKKVIVILGPTATGKSDLGVSLAKKFGGEVISADSRQVYKGLNLGTGKITRREMRGVRHHLLDVANPKKQFSVAEYKKLGERAIVSIYRNNRVPIIVGGTGLYIDTLVHDSSLPAVPPNKKLRAKLEKKSAAQLFSLLKKKDLRRAQEIDSKNPRRLIRALEIVAALGKVPKKSSGKKYDAFFIGLVLSEKDLKKKIEKRIKSRMKQGMVAEAKRLNREGLSYKRMRELGLEYRFLADLMEKKITQKEFIENLSRAIWKYTKRQMTWFKQNKNIHWFLPREIKKIGKKTSLFLSSKRA